MSHIQTIIDNHEIISFDVFDTLLQRDVEKASDIFRIVEVHFDKTYNCNSNFTRFRKKAESDARKYEQYREVNIDEIYKYLDSSFSEEQRQELKSLEIEVEIAMSTPNLAVIPWYQYAIESGKRVFIISDMYLPGAVIAKMLAKIGITKYEAIYSSCEKRVTKWEDGLLFEHIIKTNALNKSEMLHIGNDKRADYAMAKKIGLDAYLVDYVLPTKREKDLDDSIVKSMIKHHISKDASFSYRLGYTHFGPFLHSYLSWLLESLSSVGHKNLFCFSRDGYIIKEGLSLMNTDINAQYTYISRRSIITAILQYKDNLEDMMETYKSWPYQISLEKLLYRFGLSYEDYRDIISPELLKEYELLVVADIPQMKDIERIIKQLLPLIIKKSKEQEQLVSEYFKQIELTGSVACVDLGGKCSIEQAIKEYIKVNRRVDLDLNMFYVYVTSQKKDNLKSYFNKVSFTDINSTFRFSYMFLEILFSAPHGSVLGYKDIEGIIYPILEEHVYTEYNRIVDRDAIIELQRGALDFVKDFEKQVAKYIAISPETAWRCWKEFTLYPTLKEADTWGEIYVDSDRFEPLAKPYSLMYYITRPYELLETMKSTQWLAGFLTRLGRGRWINLLCVKLYDALRKN